ncbi:MAG: RNA-binding protein [Ruminococcaceae bacterium]|nr:RNA-binding protein [Oscillospiraceae bacterium]
MSLQGSIAVSLAGRDKDRTFIIVGVLDERNVLIADGRLRKVEKPKKKKLKHLRIEGKLEGESIELLKENKLTNRTAAKITASYHKCPEN